MKKDVQNTLLKNIQKHVLTFVIDGRINTVISGTSRQRQRMEELLIKMEANSLIWYGLHISNASVMSCYVRNLKKRAHSFCGWG
ncbi:DUF3095 family protein [Mucilaginibacter sp. OK283]|uniref:DUF3095 family protein n=1 Tax=Mucilaginibacter sp. OK283 TaxID=1881049 RepID=UPI001C43590A